MKPIESLDDISFDDLLVTTPAPAAPSEAKARSAPEFSALPEDLRSRLSTPVMPLLGKEAGNFVMIPNVVLSSTALGATPKLLYSYYYSQIRLRKLDNEIQLDAQAVRRFLGISRPTQWRAHEALYACGLLLAYHPRTGRLKLTMPDQFVFGHLLLLQPALLPKIETAKRRLILDAVMQHPERDVFLPWLSSVLGEKAACKSERLTVQKRMPKRSKVNAENALKSVLNPLYSIPLHSPGQKLQDKDIEPSPSGSRFSGSDFGLVSLRDQTLDSDLETPIPKLPPLPEPDEEEIPTPPPAKSRASLRAIVEPFLPTFAERMQQAEAPVDLAPAKLPPRVKHEPVTDGPDKASWPTIKWWRFIVLLADKHGVPLWCDEPGTDGGRRLTRGELYAASPVGERQRKPIKAFVELLLVELLRADKENPQADLPRLQALAVVLNELFAVWRDFNGRYLNKSPPMAFSPAYLTKALLKVKEWLTLSQVARERLTPQERTKLIRTVRVAKELAVLRIKKSSPR